MWILQFSCQRYLEEKDSEFIRLAGRNYLLSWVATLMHACTALRCILEELTLFVVSKVSTSNMQWGKCMSKRFDVAFLLFTIMNEFSAYLSACLANYIQGKYFQNSLQCGKRICKQLVASFQLFCPFEKISLIHKMTSNLKRMKSWIHVLILFKFKSRKTNLNVLYVWKYFEDALNEVLKQQIGSTISFASEK